MLRAGGEGDDRRWLGWMASLSQWTWVEKTLGDSERQGISACCSPWGFKESDATEGLNINWDCPFKAYIMIWLRYIFKFMLLEYDGAVLSSKKGPTGSQTIQFTNSTWHQGIFFCDPPPILLQSYNENSLDSDRKKCCHILNAFRTIMHCC